MWDLPIGEWPIDFSIDENHLRENSYPNPRSTLTKWCQNDTAICRKVVGKVRFRFSSLINFQSLNRHWSDLLNLIALELDREGIKERENGERGGVGEGSIIRGSRLFEGDDYSRDGYYSRNTVYIFYFILLFHRLAVRISLPFHIFLQV